MAVRQAAVAGQFYPASAHGCRAEVMEYLSLAQDRAGKRGALPGRAAGGMVPHAGWMFSGAVAAEVIAALAAEPAVETFVIFGAAHRFSGPVAAVFSGGTWETPLGEMAIDEPLAAAVIGASALVVDHSASHAAEHSIEVQVPFIKHLAPSARLLPILVPPIASAAEVGKLVAEQAEALGRRIAVLGSTDLTHYGPRYQFTPRGGGPEGLRWAKEVNDRRIIELMVNLQADQVIREASEHHNACGSGAVAAAIRASQTRGADHGHLLCHTTSNEVARGRYGPMNDAVGYAGVVFTRPTGP